jgi:hypothetical protein
MGTTIAVFHSVGIVHLVHIILRSSLKAITRESWANYFKKLLNRPEPKRPVIEKNVHKTFEYLKTEPPSYEEVRLALQKLKNNKSGGSDNLAQELFKYGGDSLKLLLEVFGLSLTLK